MPDINDPQVNLPASAPPRGKGLISFGNLWIVLVLVSLIVLLIGGVFLIDRFNSQNDQEVTTTENDNPAENNNPEFVSEEELEIDQYSTVIRMSRTRKFEGTIKEIKAEKGFEPELGNFPYDYILDLEVSDSRVIPLLFNQDMADKIQITEIVEDAERELTFQDLKTGDRVVVERTVLRNLEEGSFTIDTVVIKKD